MKQLYYFLTILLCMVFIASCRKEAKPLDLKGLWNEEVSAVYDTINHSEISSLDLTCDGIFSFVKTTNYRQYQNSEDIQTDTLNNDNTYVMQNYKEYVKGQYSVADNKIYFNGSYYVNLDFRIAADSTNTQYNYGNYIDTVAFVIDDKCLMLNLEVQESQDVRRFGQQTSYECTW